ncbi:MAG: hypothetical protein AB1705_14160 [Verrucomicrobiota bacterium]
MEQGNGIVAGVTKRRWIVGCAVLAVVGIGFYIHSLREPAWKGRPLSEWLEDVVRE